jgi:hypothetical protein
VENWALNLAATGSQNDPSFGAGSDTGLVAVSSGLACDDDAVEDRLRQRLGSHLAQGRLVLFTGAGFSAEAIARDGRQLPSVLELATELWNLAFPGDAYDDSGLQDVFEAALMQRRNDATSLLRDRLSVDPSSLPDFYAAWFSLPWHAIYTLNVDDLADAANSAFDLPRPLVAVSALTDSLRATDRGLPVVHLNGHLRDLPEVTFSGRQYAERLAAADLWYANLARELASHPVVFVGTSLDEPPLWQYVEGRGARHAAGRELRPGSYLVTPSLKQARAVALRKYNIDWVEGTARSFAADVLSALGDSAADGLRLLSQSAASDERPLEALPALQNDSVGDEREFLRGREPRWSDITAGFAVERDFDRALLEVVGDAAPRLVVVTGTAGSGKSASMMRLALVLSGRGANVVVLNHAADLGAYKIRRAIGNAAPDVLVIDDLDRLGSRASAVLDDVLSELPDRALVLVALRSSRYQGLGIADFTANRQDVHEAVSPPLGDEDIDALLDALDRANRLGALKGKPWPAQHAVFSKKCGRQLIVAMIEATSGERFHAKIESECRELAAESQLVYAVVALATNFRISLADGDVLTSVGGDPALRMRALDGLVRTHLLVRHANGSLGLRHRVVSERAVDYFRAERLIEQPLSGLVFALAASSRVGQLRDSPQGRAVIRLINHKLLIEFLQRPQSQKPDVVAIRALYDSVESVLGHDHHFLLQRGSFETEEGDLDLAKNFVDQARGLAPDDPFVRSQWAYMTLKRASRQPTDPGARDQVELAFAELDEAIAQRGRNDPYPFHIYGSQGLAWSKRAPLGKDERELLLQTLRRVVDEGLELHPGRRDLRQLAKDLQAAYLSIAVQ